MTRKTCFRCDWEGATDEPSCPNCGARPLHVPGPSPPVAHDPAPRVAEASLPGGDPPLAPDPPMAATLEEPPTETDAGRPRRSGRWSSAVLTTAALVAVIAVGVWLQARDEPPASANPTHTLEPDPTSPSPSTFDTIGGVVPARQRLDVDGVHLSYRAPTAGWERFGQISINKSTQGPQGAEAIIFWTTFPDGSTADPCAYLRSRPPDTSVAGLAAALATAPGTALVAGPTDVSVGGRAAKHVVLFVRRHRGCDPGFFYTWHDRRSGAFWPSTDVGTTIRAWVVDVGGSRLFIEAETTDQADLGLKNEIVEIIGSIRFGGATP